MKPAPFAYYAPYSLDEVLTLLSENGDEARLLAGGQSLVPAMNFRLARPQVLIDLNRVQELAYLRATTEAGTTLHIGAMTRQRTVERDVRVERDAPLLHRAMPYIAHPQIRNRGTIGGSLAHADPAAELPAVALALDAQFRLRRRGGNRWVAARRFYTGLFATALEPGEILAEIEIPPPPPRTGWSFHEFSRRHGDFALAGVAAGVTLGDDGRCASAVIALLALGERPTLGERASAMLVGASLSDGALDPAAVAEAADAAAADVDPWTDIHASVAFKRHLTRVLVRRAVCDAAAGARE